MHIDAFKGSVKNLSNWKLYIPDALLIIATLLSGLFFGYLSGVSTELIGKASIDEIIQMFLTDQNKMLTLVYSFAGFFVTNFIVGAGLISIKYCMIRDVISGKPVDLKKSFFVDGGKYMVKVVLVKIFTYYIFFIPTFLLGFKSYIQPLFYSADPELGWFVLLIFGLSMQLFSILLDILFFFKWPQLFFNEWEFRRTIRNAFRFTKNHPLLVIFTWAFIFILGMFINLIVVGLGGVNMYMIPVFWLTIGIILFRSLITLFYDVWKDLFLFQTYFNYKHK